jgi:hypothetical protein
MWYDVLDSSADKPFATYDFTSFRYWLKLLTSKLFETQSALSRHRYRLVKRLGDPLFERPTHTPGLCKKRLHESTILDIPHATHERAFKKEKHNKIRIQSLNTKTGKKSTKLLHQSSHGNHEHGLLNVVDIDLPSKRRIDGMVNNSVQSTTAPLFFQKKRRIGCFLVHGRATQPYNCEVNTKRTIQELNEDIDERLPNKYQSQRKIYLPICRKKSFTERLMEDYICKSKRWISEVMYNNEEGQIVPPTIIKKKRKIHAAAVGPIYSLMNRCTIHRSRRRWKGYTKYRRLLLKWKSRKRGREKTLVVKLRKKLRFTLH